MNPPEKPKILVLTEYYLPGYKSGGATRTVVNMIERLSDEFNFYVVTRNHDGPGDLNEYQTVKTDEWNAIGSAQVFYFARNEMSLERLKKLWLEVAPDAIYCNSFFASTAIKAVALRHFKAVPNVPLMLAPEGEFSPGALKIKKHKKQLFLAFAKSFGWWRKIIWKAAADTEKADIQRVIGENAHIYVAANMPPRQILANYQADAKPVKMPGAIKLVFLSRINRKKNLSFALSSLANLKGNVVFDVIGPCDDAEHLKECETIAGGLPKNVRVNFCGTIEHNQVAEVLSRYHFFFLPTWGENFGHVVVEALAAGCPVLLSDQTPWRNLSEKKIGWDVALSDVAGWQKILQLCVAMSNEEYSSWAEAARKFAVEWLAAPDVENANRQVLRQALNRD